MSSDWMLRWGNSEGVCLKKEGTSNTCPAILEEPTLLPVETYQLIVILNVKISTYALTSNNSVKK